MKLSVITCVKDDSEGLARTLESISNQAHQVETIVVDAGDGQSISAVVERYQTAISAIEHNVDEGISHAFNVGLERCSGDVLAILNAGDCWLPDTTRVVGDLVSNHGGCVVHGPVIFERQTGARYQIDPRVDKLKERMYVFHPTLFVPREIYARVGQYDTSFALAMDCDWCHRAIMQGIQFISAPEPLAIMQLGGRSDVQYITALLEYRRSLIKNGMSSWLPATLYFLYFVTGKTCLRLIHKMTQLLGMQHTNKSHQLQTPNDKI